MIIKDEIYGQINATEPVIEELINSWPMQRLKGLKQNAVSYYYDSRLDHTRFDHSVGVYCLLKRFGASLNEQIAGLLHDASHQVFSHVMDFVFETGSLQNHQDSIHHTLYKVRAIEEILNKHELPVRLISQFANWPMLDNELPDICADRLDYTLRDGFQVNFISKEEIKQILDDLLFEPEKGFVFKTLELAKVFGFLSYKLQTLVWHNYQSETSFRQMAEIIKYALGKNLITAEDLWLTDDEMVRKLLAVDDDFINTKWQRLINLKSETPQAYKISKFRIVDPWIGSKRLTELDKEFRHQFLFEKRKM